MADIVVTVPLKFGLANWIAEGDPAGSLETGKRYYFRIPFRPQINPGERVYVVFNGWLRGYAPLTSVVRVNTGSRTGLPPHGFAWYLCRKGRAVAITIPITVKGFRGFRYRWWDPEIELPFPDWQTRAVPL